MQFFKTKEPQHLEENTEPIRKLFYKPTKERPKPFYIYVGQKFKANDTQDALEVTDIIFRNDMYRHSGDMMFDVFVKIIAEKTIVKWKTYPWESNLDIEYNIDF